MLASTGCNGEVQVLFRAEGRGQGEAAQHLARLQRIRKSSHE